MSTWDWGAPRAHPALVDGAWVKMRTVRHLCPACTETYAGDYRRGLARTEEDLRPLLRPVKDPPSALAYLALIDEIELKGSADLEAIQASHPLTLGEAHAARWGIPTTPEVALEPDRVEVHRAVWRPLRDGEVEPPGEPYDGIEIRPGVVEWVSDTVTRDGAVSRRVLRVLESGPSARRYGPTPIL